MNARTPKKLFVIDTNVLMHDSASIYRFHEHDIFIPMVVLEELDRNKKGNTEVARNARQISRFLDTLLEDFHGDLKEGIPLHQSFKNGKGAVECSGKLFFQTTTLIPSKDTVLTSLINDNEILNVAIALKETFHDRVIIVSKDINLRIKASIVEIEAEDYFNDQVLDDVNLLYTGMSTIVSAEFWDEHGRELDSWKEEGRSFYRVKGKEVPTWTINQALLFDEGVDYIVREIEGDSAIIEPLKNYSETTVWGINARNKEQNFALNLLLDPAIDFVSLLGSAGTGKTLLALAAGLHQVLDHPLYQEIIMTRVTIPVGEDIGFLPGTEEEKMTPWMGALMDNLEVLVGSQHSDHWGKAATNDLLAHRIKVKSLNFMRGRTFQDKWLIIDEAQNLTSKQLKTLITRAGPNTKIICSGNLAQIDTPFLTETTSGLTYVVDRFKNWAHGGHITLRRGERSRLAEFASDNL